MRKTFEKILIGIGIALILLIIGWLIVGGIMWGWDGVVEKTKDILAQPVPVISCSVMSALIFVFAVISRTSIGRKALTGMKTLVSDANAKLDDAKNQLIEVKAEFEVYKELKEQQLKEVKETYEVLLVGVKQQKDQLENLVLEIGENIHNGKVEKAINDYVEEKGKQANDEISAIVETAKDEARSEYESELNDLRGDIAELKQIINTRKQNG